MYIKSIVLEGFKSYASKVEISGFDPEFNAITGLNGSGKSNILDSICFVLGINNLVQVRANSLTELVYKNGAAGINKATVSITFDNSDPRLRPHGYDQKELVVERTVMTSNKCKYTINGSTATSGRVQDLFRSTHLNVNNPHFLIMQGRITKVLNMKAEEILGMIEEAVGTRMYEDKRKTCMSNLEKKESKLREIHALLEENINPQLKKLKDDRQEYARYTRTVRDLENLTKLYTAWDYFNTEGAVKKAGEEKELMKKKLEEFIQSIANWKKEIKESYEQITQIEKKMDSECGNKLQELETELKNKQVTETKADTQLRNMKDAVNDDKKKHSDIVKNLKDEKGLLAQRDKQLPNSVKKLADLKADSDKDAKAIQVAENKFHAVNAGLSDGDGEDASLAAQLIAVRKDLKDNETETKSLGMFIKHNEPELAKRMSASKKVDKSYTQDQTLYKKLENEVKKIQDEINKLNFDDNSFENLIQQERQQNREISHQRDELESFYYKFPQLSFDYADPVKNFDRRKVRGPACMQMELKDAKDALALDIAASGKLYNIIVDDEQTGKLLLSKGQLKRRYTFIPLNKIQGAVIEKRILKEAQNLVGPQNVDLALNRIVYEDDLQPAMEYIYGNVFECPTMQAAKQVTFAQNIRKRSVTLDGELFDPAGTLSGGSMGSRGKLLADLVPIPKLKKSINEKQNALTKIRSQIENMRKIKERYESLSEQLDLKQNEANLLKARIQQSTYHNEIEECQQLQKTLEEKKAALIDCKEKIKKAASLIKELELKTSKANREDKVKAAEKAVADCKKKAAVSLAKYNAFEAEVEELKMEIQCNKDNIASYEAQIEESAKQIEKAEANYKEAEEKAREIKAVVAELSDQVKKQKSVLKSHSGDIHKIGKEKEKKLENISNAELQMQQLEHDIKNCGDSGEDARKKLKYLMDKNKWIANEKQYFNEKGSEFDFSKFDARKTAHHIKELEELKASLSKTVNTTAQNMLSSVEEQFESLCKKKQIVENDRQSILEMIREMDEQKKITLTKACQDVNKSFGSIFATLLPGANAMLVPMVPTDILKGVFFKVGFGNDWKESLNELSGGQRSLVALSLILALLLFNPAPIYILDEVDAALDLSHTMNIGKMLKMHFTKSQFIVVSLKDGMFNNANVLFRTQFSDGMSSVSRHAQKR